MITSLSYNPSLLSRTDCPVLEKVTTYIPLTSEPGYSRLMDAILRKSVPVRSSEQIAKDEARLTEISLRRGRYSEEDDPEEGEGCIIMLPTCKAINPPRKNLNADEKALWDALIKLHWEMNDCDAALVEKKLSELHVNTLRAADAWIHNLFEFIALKNNDRSKKIGLHVRQFTDDLFMEAYEASSVAFLTPAKKRSKNSIRRRNAELAKTKRCLAAVSLALQPVLKAVPQMGPGDCAPS